MSRIIAFLVFTVIISANNGIKAESLDDVGGDLFDQKVLEVIRSHPDVIDKTMQAYAEKQQKEKEAAKLQEMLNTKVDVDYGDSPRQGKKDAKYKLVIFTDFECPYCQRGDANIKILKGKLGEDLFIVQKNYPLPFHKNAKPAAKAALAAHQQGKFFEYSNKLFENQRSLSKDLYIKIAKELGLNTEKFKKDMNSDKISKLLEKDIEAASKAGIKSTPNFILNGVKITGAYPIDYFMSIIELLEKSN